MLCSNLQNILKPFACSVRHRVTPPESRVDPTGICNQSLSCLFTLSAVAVNTGSRRFNLCHLWSLCVVTLGRGNRGTACRRQEGGDEVRGGQSEAPKGSERGLLGQSVSSWPRP